MLIPLSDLAARYSIKPTGFFHVGANTGQELDAYLKLSPNIIFVEADPKVYKKLWHNIRHHDYVNAYCFLFAESNGMDVDFHIASNQGQSSSMLELGTHATAHPEVTFVDTIKLTTIRADTFLAQHNYDLTDYDFLNIDVQGAELSVLKGMGEELHKVNYAYIEVNEQELYKGCALLGEVEAYLAQHGLHRKELEMTKFAWGDMFLVRHG